MNKKIILVYMIAIPLLNSAQAQILSTQPDGEKTIAKIAKIIAIPKTKDQSGNDWSQLKFIYPKTNWITTTNKNYSDAQKASVNAENKKIEIEAVGVKSMINHVTANVYDKEDSPNFFRDQIKGLGVLVKMQCSDEDNGSSNGTIWYEITLKDLKPVYASLSWSSGSGGGSETLDLDNFPIKNTCEKNKIAKIDPIFSYLTGKIKQYDGAGCSYKLQSDDTKKGNNKIVGADSFDGSGIVLNVDGQDIIVKGSNDIKGNFSGTFGVYKVNIPSGKIKNCGEECSKKATSFVITRSLDYKQAIQVVGYCGS